ERRLFNGHGTRQKCGVKHRPARATSGCHPRRKLLNDRAWHFTTPLTRGPMPDRRPLPQLLADPSGPAGGAPRAIMTIFGTNLSDKTYQATTFPLPTQLGPTWVMVNGVATPLFYVSPLQINFQMPSGVPATAVSVVVNNQLTTANARGQRASQPH